MTASTLRAEDINPTLALIEQQPSPQMGIFGNGESQLNVLLPSNGLGVQGDGTYYNGNYWIAFRTWEGEGNPFQISLYAINGIDDTNAAPAPFTIEAMPGYTIGADVELVIWRDLLWVLSWQDRVVSLVALQPKGDSGELEVVPGSAGSVAATSDVLGLSAEEVGGDLLFFAWQYNSTSGSEGYYIEVLRDSGEGFTAKYLLSLTGSLDYEGVFDTHVFIPPEGTAIVGAEPGVPNILLVAAGGIENNLCAVMVTFRSSRSMKWLLRQAKAFCLMPLLL